jgi:hypothetical protein
VFPSKDNILAKNPGSYVINQERFSDTNGMRSWALIAII